MTKENNNRMTVSKRAFGHTGVQMAELCLGGGSFENSDARALLDEALKYGVDCWEIVSFTGNVYSEYFKKNSGIREKVFLSGKIYSTDPNVMQEQLDQVLKANGTSYLDFLAIHPVENIRVLNENVRKWVEKVKKEKRIRFFGFCTHKNMDACLNGAADLGWIDGIQTVYNYRMQNVKSMEDALQKCHENGIGIIAVKSMGLCVRENTQPHDIPIIKDRWESMTAAHNLSFEQAKLKAIWQNPGLTSICSLMPDATILHSNISAAVDKHSLHPEFVALLADYADITAKYFCRRCGACEKTSADGIPIGHIMEILMYSNGYGKKEWARMRFAQIPVEIRNKIRNSDYSEAEKKCPQKMPIARLLKQACMELHP
jgi:uncharacterized protein